MKSANEDTTRCSDGYDDVECYVAEINLKSLVDVDEDKFTSALGGNLILGSMQSKDYDAGKFGTVLVAEAWYGANQQFTIEHPGPNIFKLTDNGMRCITTPCFSFNQEKLNAGDIVTISNIELSNIDSSPEDLDEAFVVLADTGLFVAGYNALVMEDAREGISLRADQLYLSIRQEIVTLPLEAELRLGRVSEGDDEPIKKKITSDCFPLCQTDEMSGEACRSYILGITADLGKVEIIPDGSMVTRDHRLDRVRVFVNSEGIVVTPPCKG